MGTLEIWTMAHVGALDVPHESSQAEAKSLTTYPKRDLEKRECSMGLVWDDGLIFNVPTH